MSFFGRMFGRVLGGGINGAERAAGEGSLGADWQKLGTTAYGGYNYGGALTEEGLTGLRGLNATYQQRLANPLGPAAGIFTRARGAISDDAVRGQRAFGSRMFQLATQSGGTLSPEAQAELQQRNARDINESRFTAEGNLANTEASMTLNETGKLFDRMEGINKTITSLGSDEKTRALQALIASLTGRTGRMKAIMADVLGPWGHG